MDKFETRPHLLDIYVNMQMKSFDAELKELLDETTAN